MCVCVTIMTKNDDRCKICHLAGASQVISAAEGLSHPCHQSANSHQPTSPGLNYTLNSSNINHINHAPFLHDLHLPQLKDVMLAAYLLRGKFRAVYIYVVWQRALRCVRCIWRDFGGCVALYNWGVLGRKHVVLLTLINFGFWMNEWMNEKIHFNLFLLIFFFF